MKKILFLLAMLPMLLFTSCSDDDDIDFNLIEGSWGLIHSEGYEKDPSDLLEWDYNCDPLNPSSYDDAKIDIVKIDENKYYQVAYYWSVFSKKWVKEDEGYTFTISGNKIIPISNDEEYSNASFKILSLTSTGLTVEAKEGSTYYAKSVYKRLQ
mgnify:CR=1 FL=1